MVVRKCLNNSIRRLLRRVLPMGGQERPVVLLPVHILTCVLARSERPDLNATRLRYRLRRPNHNPTDTYDASAMYSPLALIVFCQ